jgi:hypothetical protein
MDNYYYSSFSAPSAIRTALSHSVKCTCTHQFKRTDVFGLRDWRRVCDVWCYRATNAYTICVLLRADCKRNV